MDTKSSTVIICIVIALGGISIFISGIVGDKRSETQIETSNTTNTTITSTNTTTTTKTSKKTVKTTQKRKSVKTASYSEYQQYAKNYSGYDDTQMSCLINLWNRESGWNPNSYNKKSGACGIPQSVPCNKIKKSEGSNDWQAQIRWGVKYINARYKTPCNAWSHFQSKHWY